MTGTVTLLAIGFLLVALLVFLARRSKTPAGELSGSLDDRPSLATPQCDERSEEVLERIFGPGDWDFIRSHSSKQVQRLFLKERTELAFCWLSQIRNQTKAAMHFHVTSARESENLQPMLELRLAIDYLAVLAKCGFIALVLLLKGPTALRSMVEQARALSDRARSLAEVASKPNAATAGTG